MKKRVISALLTAVMTLSMAFSVTATTQEKITNAKAEQQAAEEDLAESQNKITDLESKKSELETYLTELNTQLVELDAGLTDIQSQIDEKEVELEMLQAALGRARVQEEKQYNNMKLRIRYMYENSSTSLLTTLLESKSITEFLNRFDTISQISEYDREQLDTYKETKETIESQEAKISSEKEALVTLKEESEVKIDEISQLAQTTDGEIAEYTASISEEELNASNLKDEIAQQKGLLKTLNEKAEAEKRAAEEKAKKEAALKAEAEKKAEEAKKEESKKEESKQEEPKQEEPKQEQPKQEEPKQEEPKQEEPKQEEPKQEEPKQEEPKQEEPKQEEPKQEEPKQEEPKQEQSNGEYLGNFKLTAYCKCSKCCGKWANGYTASGTVATAGRTVAMAGVPFGTKLRINGHVYTVEDRGTPYGHVDIFFNTHSEALQFGRKYADVYRVN